MAKLSSTNLPNETYYNPSLLDQEYVGQITTLNISENSIGFGACLGYDSTSSEIVLSNADSTNIVLCNFIALESGIGNKKVLIKGLIRNDSWTLLPGKPIYLNPNTPGLLTYIPPNNTGDIIQILGLSISTNTILFDPDLTWLELA